MVRIALYRKYRPSSLSEVKGQEHIVKTLQNSLKKKQFSHAYLFCGPRGVGKTSVARIMAKGVNCQNLKNGDPCNKCSSCISIDEQRALDIIEIDAASNRGIDEIRDLREKVKFSPSELAYKVFIIDEVHMLTKEAFNALLKTLEEPPKHAVFIMATTEAHRIPATVISRCQRFDFKRVSENELAEKVKEVAVAEKIKISDEAVSVIVKSSEGGVRDAVSIFDQISMNAKGGKITEEEVLSILGAVDTSKIRELADYIDAGDKEKALTFLHEVIERGAEIGQVTKSLMDVYRKKLQKEISSQTSVKKYIDAIEILSECNRNFKYSVYPQLSLEVAILKIAGREEGEFVKHTQTKSTERVNDTVVEKKVGKVETVAKKGNVDISGKWSQVLFEIKSKNRSVHALVRDSEPTFYEEEVHLAFPFKFHKERIENEKNKKVVESAIVKVCGSEYVVVCNLAKATPAKKSESKTKDEKNLLDALGGELVE